MNKKNDSDLEYSLMYGEENENIDLNKVYKFFLRNKKKIIGTTFGLTSFLVLLTFTQKAIWKGSVIFLVEDNKNNQKNISSSFGDLRNRFESISNSFDIKTKEEVLKSPYVLKPIYTFVKDSSKRKNIKIKNFDSWIKKDVEIYFKEKTKILTVNLKNEDKEIILSSLSKLAKSFQDFSIEDKIKKINNGIKFFQEQSVILSEKSNKSLTKLNKFSIENGLGDIDGFTRLDEITPQDKLNFSSDSEIPKQYIRKKSITQNSGAGQRFKSQLKMLEKYETEFTRLSSKLKPETKIIKNLKRQIETLKEALKRPNQILLEYRNLKRIAERDLNLLNATEQNLSLLKFEKAREQQPWLIISNPTLSNYRVSPKRKQLAFLYFVLSFIFISLIALYQEKKKGIFYDVDLFKLKFKYKYIDKLYKNEVILNNLIIENNFKKNTKEVNLNQEKIGCLFISEQFKNESFQSELLEFNAIKKQINLNITDFKNFKACDLILIFFEIGTITSKQIIILENYLAPYEDKIIGWYYIDEDQN